MRYYIALLGLLSACLPSLALETTSALSTVGSRTGETTLGNLIADAVREALKTDCAFLASGSLREVTIPKGKVTEDQVLAALQYPNDQLAILELSGEELVKALERSVSVYPQKSLGFLQVSGVTFTFDPNAERWKRVSEVRVGDKIIEPNAKYRIAVPEPLAKGGYGYFTIWSKDNIKEVRQITIAEAVKQFLVDKNTLEYPDNSRIKMAKPSNP